MLVEDSQEGGIKYEKMYGPNNSFSLSKVKLTQAHRIPYHYHERTETVYFIIDGEGTMIVDGKEVDVRGGQMFVIPPKIPHTIFAKEKRTVDFYCKECPPDDDDFHPQNL
ncbi:MAG TPA: cupin domain-containing protein [archaeon]|nr:cupin domain-containing protein [archaeon]